MAGSLGSGGVSAGSGGTATTGGTAGGAGAGGSNAGAGGTAGAGGALVQLPIEQLQRNFVDLRFGMFLHFGILTYTGSWSQANLPISQFNPTHHDGFALWPSAASNFNVKSIPWKGGKGDVVREYVDAFRAKGLQPGLYYSIWDNTEGAGNDTPLTAAQMSYVKTQITELLSNYGPIPILVVDGWSWKSGHHTIAYEEIRRLVKSLQPNCLPTDHTHLADPWEVDVANFEEPAGGFAPANNTYAAQQEQKINASGGNDWFWAPNIGGLMSRTSIVDGHLKLLEPRWTNFILNCPPNRDGLLDSAIVTRLAEVGAAWSPNASRPPLPAQLPVIEHPYAPVSATATSGNAANAIDGKNDRNSFTMWQTTGPLPQSITLDLGQVRADVSMLDYVPRYVNTGGGTGSTDGAITSYTISVSSNGTTYSQAGTGTWAADGKMKHAAFTPVAARYVRLTANTVMGTAAVATEITVGAK
ncbi:MAG: alpha-L-fucosidase [Myxococcales bacterium]